MRTGAGQVGGQTSLIDLISPNSQLVSETPLTIPIGGQLMIMAFGLQEDDEVTLDMLKVDTSRPPNACAPVVTPSVSDIIPLEYKLTAAKPYIILDSPQGVPLRASLVLANGDDVADTQWVQARIVNVQAINERMRGL